MNGFSKCPDEAENRQATVAIAREVLDRAARLRECDPQGLANLVNGFSKWPEEPQMREAVVAIARCVHGVHQLSCYSHQQLANLVNGFSKWPGEPQMRRATVAIAHEVLRVHRLSVFTHQQLANLVNGFSKWPEEAKPRQAAGAIAREIFGIHQLSCFTHQELANLVNGFSKWPEEASARRATLAIAREVLRGHKYPVFTHQQLANLVNGFSKWPEEEDACHAIIGIAREVLGRTNRLPGFGPQELANLVNGFSKWTKEAETRRATIAIGREVICRTDRLVDFKPQELAALVNGFSKWPDEEDSAKAIVAIGREIFGRSDRLVDFTPQELANVVNGLSKWPDEKHSGKVIVAIAREVFRRADRLSDVKPRELANLVNGFSKWPEEAETRRATMAIGRDIFGRSDCLVDFTPQELANLVNGFSKWPDEVAMRQAVVAIAGEILRRRPSDLSELDLSHLVNGFSKWQDEERTRQATVAIAGEIVRSKDQQLSRFSQQHLANLANAFSKWPEASNCRKAIIVTAREVVGRADQLFRFGQQDLANLVSGFSKLPEKAETRQATVALAGEIRRRRPADFAERDLSHLVNGFSKWAEAEVRQTAVVIAGEVLRRPLSGFAEVELAYLLNSFDKWPDEPACHQATIEVAHGLGMGGRHFGSFTMPELSMIANALGRSAMRGEDSEDQDIAQAELFKDRLHQLAHYLHYADERLEQTDVVSIVTIFKALAKVRLFEDLGLLAPIGLNRLTELHRAAGFAAENNFETIGNLSVALLPLVRSPQKQLRWHRRQALYLLNDIQSVVEQKIKAHLKASEAERNHGPCSSRSPALSTYQVLKARAVLQTLFRSPYVEGKKRDLEARQQQLQRGTREILASTRQLIEGDLSNMSWNVIAQIEAEGPVDALDSFMAQDPARVQAQHPASVFDVHEVLRDMDHEPRPPQGETGLMQLPVVDLQGRRLATEPEIRYSVFHRLTQGKVPVVAVQLPGQLSAFLLARTFSVDGVPYRMDLFGGSKLRPPKPPLSQLAARTPGEQPVASSAGKLLAIPYAETGPGTAFEQLSRAWAPFKEAYWYTQRRGFAAPPSIKGLGPHDYALEGAFGLSLLPDRAASEPHPFKLTGPQGPIALRPHDGCGFIKASLAERMTAIRRAGHDGGPDRVPAFGEGRRSSLPASALVHYPRSKAVADEARQKASAWLDSKEGRKLGSEDLFRTVTAGHIDAPGAVAVPSSDGRLHVPTLKSETLMGTGGVLIGRSPYDKPNLRPFAAEQVKSAADGDPTSSFLDRCVAMQYSFNAAQKSNGELAAGDPIFFAKGILIVVPDKMWPAAFADRGVVMSAEDVKCHSRWTTAKDRAKQDTSLDCVGVLQATEVFAPGSLVAVPPDEQKKLDGDFDGDTVIVLGDRPALYQHVLRFDQKEQARGVRSLKPPKSYTPAIEGERYQFSRAGQILAATTPVLEIYSHLQRSFLAQSHDARRWFAERAVFGIYEGVHHGLKGDLYGLLDQEQASRPAIQDALERARHEVEIADHPVAHEMADLLIADLEAWAAGEQVTPTTVDSVNGARRTVSPQLCELFPDLAEAYPAAAQPRDRVQLIVDHYPARIDPRPDGYDADDLVQSTNNLLSLGIKVGTDGYKSDTGVRVFLKKSRLLQRLLSQTPGLKPVPFTKSMAPILSQGRFDIDEVREDLKDNPTLAASVMEAAIELADERRILPEPSGLRPAGEASAMMVALTPEEASERAQIETVRAKAEEKTITATTISVVASLKQADIQVNMPHLDRCLKSEASIREQLTGMRVTSEGAAQLISNAVRHVFEVPDRDFARTFKKAMLAFNAQGYAEISTTNWFRMHNPTFVGIKTVLATPSGYRFELEFHTPDSYKAKIANHDTYKELEKLRQQGSGGDLERLRAEQRVREVCRRVAIPDGTKNIPHWETEAGRRSGARAALELRATEPGRREIGEIVTALRKRPIVLVGMAGAGKSTIGRLLAKRLQLSFIDSDAAITTEAGMSIRRLSEIHGEQHFRELEARVIARALENGSAVLATGSDAFIHDETRSLIRQTAVSIWLKASENVIIRRNKKRSRGRLMQNSDPEATVRHLLSAREPVYQTADLTVASGGASHKISVNECLVALHAHLCGGEESARTTTTGEHPSLSPPALGDLSSTVAQPSAAHQRAPDFGPVIGQGRWDHIRDRWAPIDLEQALRDEGYYPSENRPTHFLIDTVPYRAELWRRKDREPGVRLFPPHAQ